MLENIKWLGHDTFRIIGEKVIYTDPFQIKNLRGLILFLLRMNTMTISVLRILKNF